MAHGPKGYQGKEDRVYGSAKVCVCKSTKMRVYTVPVKSLDTPSHSMVFRYFLFCSTWTNIQDIETMKEQILNYVVNKKMLNKPEYVLYFRFFKVATFCCDDSFDTFGILSSSFTR